MNQRIEKLPKWKGFPIPFFVTYTKDGIPDFKVINEDNRVRCAKEKLCWICGEPLDPNVICFVSGPVSISQGCFTDGPMHEECARDSMELCPFLHGDMGYATDFRLDRHEKKIEFQFPQRINVPPEYMGLYKTTGFDPLIVRRPSDGWACWLFKAKPAIAIEMFPRKRS